MEHPRVGYVPAHYTAWTDLQTCRQNLNLNTIGAGVGMENVRADLASSIDISGDVALLQY